MSMPMIDPEQQKRDEEAQREYDERMAQAAAFHKEAAKRATAAADAATELAERRRKATLAEAAEQAKADTSQFGWEIAARKAAGEPGWMPNSSGLTQTPDGIGPQINEAPGVNGITVLNHGGEVAGTPRAAFQRTVADRELATTLAKNGTAV